MVSRSNRRCPPGVTYASIRPSSAQRRSVSGSTPTIRLAGPRDNQRGAARVAFDTRGLGDWGADESGARGGIRTPDSSTWLVCGTHIWVNLGTDDSPIPRGGYEPRSSAVKPKPTVAIVRRRA